MAYIGKTPQVGNYQKCDALNASATADYTLQVSSTNVVPESVNHMIVSLNGVIQSPTTAYTVSGSTLSFSSSLTSNDSIDFILLLGNVLDIGTPSDDTCGAAQIKDDLISGTTALTAEPATTDELLLSDAGTLKRIDYSLITNTPAFEAYLSSDQAVSDGVDTKVEIDTEVHDTDGCYDHATNYRFTPDVAGKYFIYGSTVGYGGAITDIISSKVMIYKNGAYYAGSETNYNANLIQRSYNTVSSVIDMNGSSDYLELYGFVNGNSGGSEVFSNAVGSKSNLFGGYKLTGA